MFYLFIDSEMDITSDFPSGGKIVTTIGMNVALLVVLIKPGPAGPYKNLERENIFENFWFGAQKKQFIFRP